MPDNYEDLPTDVAQLQADLRADRETIRLLAAQLIKREKRFTALDLLYLAKRGTLRPTEKLRQAVRAYHRMQEAKAKRNALDGSTPSPSGRG